MLHISARTLALAVVGLGASVSLTGKVQTPVDVQRTVYFTATNPSGLHPADLTAEDVIVREGGAERQILRLEPSVTRLKVGLVIDEGLSPDVMLRQAAMKFIQQIRYAGDIALYLVGRGNAKLVDYSTDLQPFLNAVNAFPLRAQGDGNIVESVFEIAKGQRALEGRRVIVLLATEIPQMTTVTANGVLDELQRDGTVLYAVTLVGPAGVATPASPDMAHLEVTEETERDRMLNDGTKQSGGLRLSALRIEGFAEQLDRIRGDLLNQYAVTYLVPKGSKSDGRLTLTTTRKGIMLRGPGRVPKL